MAALLGVESPGTCSCDAPSPTSTISVPVSCSRRSPKDDRRRLLLSDRGAEADECASADGSCDVAVGRPHSGSVNAAV